jgi:hypothetical protein
MLLRDGGARASRGDSFAARGGRCPLFRSASAPPL